MQWSMNEVELCTSNTFIFLYLHLVHAKCDFQMIQMWKSVSINVTVMSQEKFVCEICLICLLFSHLMVMIKVVNENCKAQDYLIKSLN